MHRKNMTCNVLSIVLVVFVSYVCPYEIDDPVIRIIDPKGFHLAFLGLSDVSGINFSAFLVFNDQSNLIVQNGSFYNKISNWWNYENSNIKLMSNQVIRFEIHIRHKEYGEVTVLKEYKVPLWPGNALTNIKTCQISETTVQERSVCADELIFEDNFDLLSKPTWTSEFRIPLDVDDADFVIYRSIAPYGHTQHGNFYFRPTVADETTDFDEKKIRTGALNLIACTSTVDQERECKRQANSFRILPPILSAKINTKNSFSFRYGKIEVRAKLPKGDWLFPLITLEPKNPDHGVVGHASGQLRVAFIRCNEHLRTKDDKPIDGSYLFGGAVLNIGESDRETWLRSVHGSEHWGNDFHNYTLTWTNTTISLGCDGKTYATLTGGFNRYPLSRMAPFDKEFYISIGLSAGGISDFPDDSISGTHEKPWNNTDPKGELKFYNARHKWRPTWKEENHHLLINHVKVWAL